MYCGRKLHFEGTCRLHPQGEPVFRAFKAFT